MFHLNDPQHVEYFFMRVTSEPWVLSNFITLSFFVLTYYTLIFVLTYYTIIFVLSYYPFIFVQFYYTLIFCPNLLHYHFCLILLPFHFVQLEYYKETH